MRIGVSVRTRSLASALAELLTAAGHDVLTDAAAWPTCDLVICPERNGDAPHHGPTLYLRPAAFERASSDPAASLRATLRGQGRAVWDSPLDANLLLQVLAEIEGVPDPQPARAPKTPDLSTAPYPWFLIDVGRRRLTGWNRQGGELLTLPTVPPNGGLPLDDALLPGALRQGILNSGDGRMPIDSLGGPQIATWWTGADGARVLCLIEDPGDRDAPADRHLRNLAEIGRMAATLAHEIRNPVASLAGALDLIADAEDPDERADIIRLARERLLTMRQLLDDTLRMSRPLDQELETIELQALVRSAATVVATNPVVADVDLSMDLPSVSIHIAAHLGPLQQAIVNLLVNAAEAQKGRGRIVISACTEDRRGIIRVRDSGPGIPKEKRDRVFQPFYTSKAAGTGLGLAFVRRVVEAAGGSVFVEDVDSGTSIRLQLPLLP